MSNSEPLVMLQRGFCVPVEAFNLVLDCEAIGVKLTARGNTLDVDGPHTPELLERLKAWKPHVLAVLAYTPTDRHLFDDSIQPPHMGPIHQVTK